MLAYPDVRRLVDVGDRYDNHPLHIAAQEGYLSIVKVWWMLEVKVSWYPIALYQRDNAGM